MPDEELTDIGRIIVVREGEPLAQSLLGKERERALARYLLGRPTPGYDFYLGGDGGAYQKLDPQKPPKLRQDVLEYYQNERGWNTL